jgi:hypothetical protein
MTSVVWSTTMDCREPYELSVWWGEVLDYAAAPGHPNSPGEEECLVQSADGRHRVLFIRVPEAKSVKNRVHFDLRPATGTRDEEVARVLALGATEVADLRTPDGKGWVVLADPEGNEFCVLRSEAEVAATT